MAERGVLKRISVIDNAIRRRYRFVVIDALAAINWLNCARRRMNSRSVNTDKGCEEITVHIWSEYILE